MAQLFVSDISFTRVWVNANVAQGNLGVNATKSSKLNKKTKVFQHSPLVDLRSWACTDTHGDATSSEREGIPSLQGDKKSQGLRAHGNSLSSDENNESLHRKIANLHSSQIIQSLILQEHNHPSSNLFIAPHLQKRGNTSPPTALPECVIVTQPATSSDDDVFGGNAPLNVSVHCANAGLTKIPYPLPETTKYLLDGVVNRVIYQSCVKNIVLYIHTLIGSHQSQAPSEQQYLHYFKCGYRIPYSAVANVSIFLCSFSQVSE